MTVEEAVTEIIKLFENGSARQAREAGLDPELSVLTILQTIEEQSDEIADI